MAQDYTSTSFITSNATAIRDMNNSQSLSFHTCFGNNVNGDSDHFQDFAFSPRISYMEHRPPLLSHRPFENGLCQIAALHHIGRSSVQVNPVSCSPVCQDGRSCYCTSWQQIFSPNLKALKGALPKLQEIIRTSQSHPIA